MFDNGTMKPATDYRSLVTYGVTNEEIENKKAAFAAIEFTNSKGYEEGRKAIRELVGLRSAIEDRRKELKKESLEFGRFVDSEAKRWTLLIESIEEPLKLKKAVIDEEKDRIRREKEAAEKARIEAEERAKREAEEARQKAIRDEEEKRLAEERKRLEVEAARLAEERRQAEEAVRVERERLAAERAKMEAEQKAEKERQEVIRRAEEEKLDEARRAIESERRRVNAERQAQERAEFERQTRIKAEQEAKAKAEREAREAEERRIAEAERKEADRKRMEALRPDLDKVAAFADLIAAIQPPSVGSEQSRAVVELAMKRLTHTAGELKSFVLRSSN